MTCICAQEGFTHPSCPDYKLKKGIHIMSKRTPGPWQMNLGKSGCFHEGNRVSITYYHPAEDAGEGTSETVAEVWSSNGDTDIADGNLIAAAPELLEALKGLLIEWGSTKDMRIAEEIAEEAISKAEGN